VQSLVAIAHQLGDFVQQLLQIVIGDLVREARNKRLCFFGGIAAERACEFFGQLLFLQTQNPFVYPFYEPQNLKFHPLHNIVRNTATPQS
jgi:hypothetical protein